MKKLLLSAVLLMLAYTAFTQEPTLYPADTEHYRVLSEISPAHAEELAGRLEATARLFNRTFHFDMPSLPGKLQVKIFSTRNRFNAYLTEVISQQRDDYVYLHYSNPDKRILLGFFDPEGAYEASLNRQAFIQYLKAFVPNPPLWIREGFATYFEKVHYDADKNEAVFRENHAWLDRAKEIAERDFLPPEDFLTMDVDTAQKNIAVFYPQAWAVVSFFKETENPAYLRTLWDSLTAMDPESNLDQNSQRIVNSVFSWIDGTAAWKDFLAYLEGKHSFRDLLQTGITEYSEENMKDAEKTFLSALGLEDGNPLPYYYLGLICYEKEDYAMAEYYYMSSLQLGLHAGVGNYALGVNALAGGRKEEARSYLLKARDEESGEYRENAEKLLERLK